MTFRSLLLLFVQRWKIQFWNNNEKYFHLQSSEPSQIAGKYANIMWARQQAERPEKPVGGETVDGWKWGKTKVTYEQNWTKNKQKHKQIARIVYFIVIKSMFGW